MNPALRNFFLTLCASAVAPAAVAAESPAVWLGSGNYSVSSNWSNNFRPNNDQPFTGDTYAVTINAGSMTLDRSATVNSLVLGTVNIGVSGPQILTSANTTIGNGVTLSSGTLGLAGTISATAVNTDLYLNINGGAGVSNSGTFTHAATGTGQTAIVFDANASGASTFRNASTGTFTANTSANDASLGYGSGSANSGNVFINEGIFNKTGTRNYAANVAFQNSGTVNVQQGALQLNGGDNGSTTGAFAISSGATLSIGSAMHLSSGSSLSGAGTVQLKSGSAAFSSGSSFTASNLQIQSGTMSFLSGSTLSTTALTMSGGTLQLDIDHTFSGASLTTGGTITGIGHTTLANTTLGTGNFVFGGTGVKEFVGATSFTTTTGSQYFNINGGAEVKNSGNFTQARTGSGDNALILNADSTGGSSIFRNGSTGTFTANMASGDGSVGFASASTGNRFINEGSFIKTGTGAYAFNVGLTNSGSVNIQQGTLNLNSGGSASGSFTVGSGTTLGLNGTLDLQSGASIGGTGTVKVNGGATTFLSGSSLTASALQLVSGTTAFRTGSTLGTTSLSINGGTLELDIDHTFTGASFNTGGGVTGAGHATFAGTTSFDQNSYVFGGTGVKEFSGTVNLTTNFIDQYFNINGGSEVKNSGSFTQTRNGSGQSAIILNANSAGGSSIFRNATGATFTAAMSGGAGSIGAGAASAGNVFINQGTFNKTGNQDYSVNVAFANSGTANVQQGLLSLTAGDSGSTTGSYSIASNSTLAVNGGFTFGSGSSVSGAGTFQPTGGTTTFVPGSSFTASTLKLTGGTTAFLSGSTLGTTALTVTNSTLRLDIDHTFASVTFANGGTILGSGHTTFSGTTTFDQNAYNFGGTGVKEFSGTVSLLTSSADQFLNINGGGAEVKNSGNFTQTRNGSGQSVIVLNADSTGGSSVFRNGAGATFTANMNGGDGGVSAGAASSGNKFINEGTFNKSGSRNYNVDVAFANSGTVNVQQSILALNAGDGGSTTGSFNIQNGGTLSLGGSFAFGSGASVSGAGTFQVNNGTTTFGSGSSFAGSTLKLLGGTTAFLSGSTLGATTLTMSGSTLRLDIDHTFAAVPFTNGGSVTGSGHTTFSGTTTFDQNAYNFGGTGVKEFTGNVALASSSADQFFNVNGGGAEVKNSGIFTQTRGGTGQSAIVLNADSTGGTSIFRNATGATFTATMTSGSGGISAGAANSGSKFINEGTFSKAGANAYNADVAFANSGTVNVQQGLLSLNAGDGGSTTGAFSIQTGTTLALGGGFTLGSGATVSGAGTFQANNGTTTFNSGSSLTASILKIIGGLAAFRTGSTLDNATALNITGGTLELDIDHAFTNAAISTGATIGGTGTTTFGGTTNLNSTTLTISGTGVKQFTGTTTFAPGATASFLNLTGNSSVTNSGTFTQTKTGTAASGIILASDGGLASTFRNNNTFIADIANGTATMGYGGASVGGNKFVNTGTFTKSGIGVYQINVAVDNSGSMTVSQGTLSLTSSVTGKTGSITTNAGTALDLSENVHTDTVGTLAHNGASLNLGANDIVVATDYQNSHFGTGNSFNAHANVLGTGKILADTGTSLSYGADVTGTTLAFGVLHVGDAAVTKNYTVKNTGTGGVAVRGAIQTTVGGASITDSRLTGAGLTAFDLGKLDQGASTTQRAITFTPATVGALTGQQLHVATNFDNVTPANLAVTGQVNYYADPAWTNATGSATLTKINDTTYTLSFGTISLGSGMITASIDLLNELQDAIYQDALNGSFVTSGVIHFSLSGFNTVSNIASGSSQGGFSISIMPNTMGNYSDTLTLNPTSSNASSTSNLSAIQLTIQASVVPEPGVLALLALAALPIVLFRRKLRSDRAA